MKKTVLLFMLAFAAHLLHAQVHVGGKNLNTDFKGKYITIKEGGIVDKKNYSVEVDFGQIPGKTRDEDRLTDENGKALGFESMVGALNYFYEQGWEFESLIFGGDYSSKRYLLKRK